MGSLAERLLHLLDTCNYRKNSALRLEELPFDGPRSLKRRR